MLIFTFDLFSFITGAEPRKQFHAEAVHERAKRVNLGEQSGERSDTSRRGHILTKSDKEDEAIQGKKIWLTHFSNRRIFSVTRIWRDDETYLSQTISSYL